MRASSRAATIRRLTCSLLVVRSKGAKNTPATPCLTYWRHRSQPASSLFSAVDTVCPHHSGCASASGEAAMPWQIGSKISVSPRSRIKSPNACPAIPPPAGGAAAAFGRATKVPEPARRSTRPSRRNSRTARPTVMRETPNCFVRAASLGSRAPGGCSPRRMASRSCSRMRWYLGVSLGERVWCMDTYVTALALRQDNFSVEKP